MKSKISMLAFFLLLLGLNAFGQKSPERFLVVLGTVQDAGYPQIGCQRADCLEAQKDRNKRKLVVSLGLVDKGAKQKWLFEATPDIGEQLYALNQYVPSPATMPDGIFLTHAHIGHYTGLMYLGHEAVGARGVPVFAMPRMKTFLTENGPWSQLVSFKNIELKDLVAGKTLALNPDIKVTPFPVPHREEFSETVGFEIAGPEKTAVFIPDINKWSIWKTDLKELIKRVDYAIVDASFYKNGEIPNRDMSEFPHPFVEETISLLKDLSPEDKAKVIFIHFNHTNPLIKKNSKEKREVLRQGFRVAEEGMILGI
ncbi:MAG: MBL fold metallo-hydrolase [Pyrinomonadaceae bacterium]